MGSLWRSQEMQLIQLYIQKDAAHDTVDELGELGNIQFHDMNPGVNAFQRNFVAEVKRCDEMERKLRFLREHVHKEEAELKPGETLTSVTGARVSPASLEAKAKIDMEELESTLDTHEKELRHMNQSQEALAKNYNELLEMMYVLTKDAAFFEESAMGGEAASTSDRADISEPLLAEDGAPLATAAGSSSVPSAVSRGLKIGFVTGVVLKLKVHHFERVLWRALHGNLYQRTSDIDDRLTDPATGEKVEKTVFIVFYHGEQSLLKIRKICEAFGARICPCPDTRQTRMELLEQVNGRIGDMKMVIAHSVEHRRQLLATISTQIVAWTTFVRREKAIYHVMNMCNYDVGRKCLIAEGWCPSNGTDDVLEALNRATKRSGSQASSIMSFVKSKEEPPTHFVTNQFTSVFQGIVNAYGTARYREVNPAVLSVITFPFLFAIMFGDAGHALIMMLFSIALIKAYPKLKGKKLNEVFEMMLDGRWLLLLMSIFSIYTGLLYNEVFSIPVSIFKPTYHNPDGGHCEAGLPCKKTGAPYPFGIDPIWRAADNELFLYNSLKMKLSVIFGVIQMTAGITMSLFNHVHFRKPLNIFFEFIPMLLFMLCTFGYMTFLIFFKWLAPSITTSAPYIINVMIDMVLKFPGLPEDERLYPGQNGIQVILVIIAVTSVFVMLIPKPVILYIQDKKKHQYQTVGAIAASTSMLHSEEDDDAPAAASSSSAAAAAAGGGRGAGHGEEEPFNFGETFIHQAIHTIDYVLGCISNTASYLRLWALSLAHSQLSVVFYEQVFLLGIKMGNFVIMFVCFAVWGFATIGILLLMEALSAFLHALRLHWVEFMNKFYNGDGYLFVPFSFERVLTEQPED